MPGRKETDYHRADLLSDVLGRGKSSRLHQALVKDESIFNSIGAYVTGSADPGLLVVSGKLNEGITFQEAEQKVWEVISNLLKNGLEESELEKVKNKAESSLVFSEMELLNTAMNLAYSAFLGNPDFVNQETDKITAVTVDGVLDIAKEILVADNCNVLAYAGNKKETA